MGLSHYPLLVLQQLWKWLSSISLTFEIMNPYNGMNHNNNKDRTKAAGAIPMSGAIVTAALLLSGLSFISSYQPAIAQENMTGAANVTNATMAPGNVTNVTAAGNVTNVTAAGNVTNVTAAGNATTGGQEGGDGGILGPLEGIFGGGGGQ
jgi:hypothetical protein